MGGTTEPWPFNREGHPQNIDRAVDFGINLTDTADSFQAHDGMAGLPLRKPLMFFHDLIVQGKVRYTGPWDSVHRIIANAYCLR
jgi:aryl-alcohol dehydrogenase-like predicted oxidoreductase